VLLQKGIREMPDKWQYFHDAGFVEYWWRRDAQAAADWFIKGSKLHGAPEWLEPLAASVLAQHGEREASRAVWTQLNRTADHEWIRQAARRGLLQLDAEGDIEILEGLMHKFFDVNGRFPTSWQELIRARLLRSIPVDPSGSVYELDPVSGSVNVAQKSSLFPLRRRTS